MNTFLSHVGTIPVIVGIVAVIAGALALFQYLPRVMSWLKRFEAFGSMVKDYKDAWLNRWISLIPLSADTMSILQPVFIGIAISAYYDHRYRLATTFFVAGWMLDAFDGGKARYEAKIRGRPSSYGHVLDPTKDILCFLMMVWAFWAKFPPALMIIFSSAIAIRALYGGLLLARKFWTNLPPLRMLPESIAGKYKTLFASIAFGLIIAWPVSKVAGQWATKMLAFATILEFISLLQQAFRAIWPKPQVKPTTNNIVPFRRTGND